MSVSMFCPLGKHMLFGAEFPKSQPNRHPDNNKNKITPWRLKFLSDIFEGFKNSDSLFSVNYDFHRIRELRGRPSSKRDQWGTINWAPNSGYTNPAIEVNGIIITRPLCIFESLKAPRELLHTPSKLLILPISVGSGCYRDTNDITIHNSRANICGTCTSVDLPQ